MKERQVLTLAGVPMVLILLGLLALRWWWLQHSERGTQPFVNTGTLYSG
ncbi:MAG TPA: hypothetical protein VGE08_08970 [Steroidobacter sp.]